MSLSVFVESEKHNFCIMERYGLNIGALSHLENRLERYLSIFQWGAELSKRLELEIKTLTIVEGLGHAKAKAK